MGHGMRIFPGYSSRVPAGSSSSEVRQIRDFEISDTYLPAVVQSRASSALRLSLAAAVPSTVLAPGEAAATNTLGPRAIAS
jgi:hypothetical protein